MRVLQSFTLHPSGRVTCCTFHRLIDKWLRFDEQLQAAGLHTRQTGNGRRRGKGRVVAALAHYLPARHLMSNWSTYWKAHASRLSSQPTPLVWHTLCGTHGHPWLTLLCPLYRCSALQVRLTVMLFMLASLPAWPAHLEYQGICGPSPGQALH
jgi:hypothetical protein